MRKKAQVSMEYMMVVGFSLLMIMPIIAIYGMERQSINNQVNAKQAGNIAKKIVDSAETVYYLGKPAKTTLKVYMPSNVERIEINNREIVFKVRVGKLLTDIVGTSQVNMTGNLSTGQGIQYIDIAADNYVVNITNQ